MVINSKFIQDTITEFHNSFMQDSNWCKISAYAPENETYLNRKYQKIYALRFIPAYYFEYSALAASLNKRLQKLDIKKINIASFGCGLAPDYYALRDNLDIATFNYTGFDCAKWSTQELMPPKNNNFKFLHEYAHNLDEDLLHEFDVFVFPKSIRDIANSGHSAITDLANVISTTPKDRVFFLNSYVCTKNQQSLDLPLFEPIHNALTKSGFQSMNKLKSTYFMKNPLNGDSFAWLIQINRNYIYPSNRKILCPNEGSKQECNGCIVVKNPIFSNEFMDYQLLEYART